MNQAPADASAFMKTFVGQYARQQDRRVLFFPPAVSLHVVVQAIKERADLEAGVQNMHWEDKGAFTGETSGPLARAAGARHALIGHSERRHVFGETDEETGKKVAAAFKAGLTPILCVGETSEEKEKGLAGKIVLEIFERIAVHDGDLESEFFRLFRRHRVEWRVDSRCPLRR